MRKLIHCTRTSSTLLYWLKKCACPVWIWMEWTCVGRNELEHPHHMIYSWLFHWVVTCSCLQATVGNLHAAGLKTIKTSLLVQSISLHLQRGTLHYITPIKARSLSSATSISYNLRASSCLEELTVPLSVHKWVTTIYHSYSTAAGCRAKGKTENFLIRKQPSTRPAGVKSETMQAAGSKYP